jgi:isoleucyl-tRNA synthetase
MKKAVAAIAAFTPAQVATLLDGGQVAIELDGKSVVLDPADVLIQRTPKAGLAVASSGALVVALETALTPELVQEGHARELINRIQNQRKTQDLDVADRIALKILADQELLAAVKAHCEVIAAETLAVKLETVSGAGDIDINGHLCALEISRV